MKRHFALPIAFAAALHGALLFGYHPEPKKRPAASKDTTHVYVCGLPLPDEPVVVPEPTEPGAKPALPDRPERVAQPEPVALPTDAGPIFRPPQIDVTGLSDLKVPPRIPTPVGKPGEGGPGALALADLDAIPRARLQSAPLYPHEARREGLRGEVLVEFTVDGTGSVVDARAVRSSNRVFEDSAVRAILKWRFEPGRQNGRVVSFRMVVPVVFSLAE